MANDVLTEMAAITEATTSKPPRLKRRTIRLDDGHKVGISTCGEGVPLVMVHGVIAEGMLYARSLRRLAAAGFKVIAVDSAGHGRTDGLGPKGWTWNAYVDLHEQVLDQLGIEKAVFVGHSMGGRIVVELAARRPERAIAVIPINAAIGGLWDRLTSLSTTLMPALMPAGIGLIVADTAVSVLRGRSEMGQAARLVMPTLMDRLRTLPSLPGALFATARATGSIELLTELGEAGVPVIVVHGEHDLVVWTINAKQAARAANGTFVRVVHGAHSWLLENADSLPALVGSLLETTLGRALSSRVGSIDECYGPEAIALTIDRPRSKPYHLEPGHLFVVEQT